LLRARATSDRAGVRHTPTRNDEQAYRRARPARDAADEGAGALVEAAAFRAKQQWAAGSGWPAPDATASVVTLADVNTNALNRAGELLNARDYADLKTQVRQQGEALKLMHEALREVARELKRLDGGGLPGSRARY